MNSKERMRVVQNLIAALNGNQIYEELLSYGQNVDRAFKEYDEVVIEEYKKSDDSLKQGEIRMKRESKTIRKPQTKSQSMIMVNAFNEIVCPCGGLVIPERNDFNTGEYVCSSCNVWYVETTPDNFKRRDVRE